MSVLRRLLRAQVTHCGPSAWHLPSPPDDQPLLAAKSLQSLVELLVKAWDKIDDAAGPPLNREEE